MFFSETRKRFILEPNPQQNLKNSLLIGRIAKAQLAKNHDTNLERVTNSEGKIGESNLC
jgi:hypothetical protein